MLLELLLLVEGWFPNLSISSDMILVIVGAMILQVQSNVDKPTLLKIGWVLLVSLDHNRKLSFAVYRVCLVQHLDEER